jgi:hypothetical protein
MYIPQSIDEIAHELGLIEQALVEANAEAVREQRAAADAGRAVVAELDRRFGPLPVDARVRNRAVVYDEGPRDAPIRKAIEADAAAQARLRAAQARVSSLRSRREQLHFWRSGIERKQSERAAHIAALEAALGGGRKLNVATP